MPVDVKRALTDQAYLDSLTPEERKEVLEKAAELGEAHATRIKGAMRLDAADLGNVVGGVKTIDVKSVKKT